MSICLSIRRSYVNGFSYKNHAFPNALRAHLGVSIKQSPLVSAIRTVITERIKQFDPPAGLKELDEKQRTEWSNWISQRFDFAAKGYPEYYINDGPRSQFYNPLKTDPATDGKSAKVSWVAFPRLIQINSPNNRWEVADKDRDNQDEYCEWNVVRDSVKKITRVVFTCEGPEYWEFLGKHNPELVLKLNQEHVSPNVKKEDLFINGSYSPKNKWNNSTTDGIMHLIQPNNTLQAEIELAAGASVVRRKSANEPILENQQELIQCGRFGAENRNSDPFIGAQVNALARQKAFITLLNPVGLYLDDFKPRGWQTPDKSDPASYWKIVRGTTEAPLRAVYEVPSNKGFTVGDITINGNKIAYGAQIADFVRIKINAYAQNFGKSTAAPLNGCRSRKPQIVTQITKAVNTAKSIVDSKTSTFGHHSLLATHGLQEEHSKRFRI